MGKFTEVCNRILKDELFSHQQGGVNGTVQLMFGPGVHNDVESGRKGRSVE